MRRLCHHPTYSRRPIGGTRPVTSDTVRIVLVTLLVVAAGCSSDEVPRARPSTTGGQVLPDGPSLAIEVTRVPDGDSIRADGDGRELEIRLIGVNAPEGDECLGDESRSRLEELLAAGSVELRPWPADLDDFGRTLGLLTAGDVFVNLAMLESGHAVAREQSDHPHARDFENAESRAADAGLGVWAPDACGPATTDQVEIVELMANAPGDDRQNPNGEFVVIENVGGSDADLSGWTMRDESTRHRYMFPSVILGPGQSARLRSGCGDDDLSRRPIELFWCDPEPPVWNNGGDTAFLLDSAGNTVDFLRS